MHKNGKYILITHNKKYQIQEHYYLVDTLGPQNDKELNFKTYFGPNWLYQYLCYMVLISLLPGVIINNTP